MEYSYDRTENGGKKMNTDKPCCAAAAMRKIRQVSVGNTVVGLSMLEQVFRDVADSGISGNSQIRSELLRQVKIYNYVPKPAEDAYADAVFEEYQKEQKQR